MSGITDEEIDGMMDWYDQALANGQGFQSEEERQAYFDELGDPLMHPFWAESTEDLEGNPMVEAFRCLREEDKTKVELALMYKDEGNEWIKKKTKKDLNEAIARYNHAFTFLDEADLNRKNDTEEEGDKGVNLHQVRSQILNNRALASMQLKNYGSALRDINKALLLWPEYVKGHFRRAKCLLQMRRPELALKACDAGLLHIGEEDAVRIEFASLRTQCAKELERLESIAKTAEASRLAVEERWRSAWRIAATRGAKFGPAPSKWRPPPQMNDHHLPFLSAEDGSENWPMVMLYPQHSQIDVIQGTDPSVMLVMLLAEMFPEPEGGQASVRHVQWDINGEYHVSNLVVFVQVNSTVCFDGEEEWMQFNRDRVTTGGQESDVECASMQYDAKRRGDHARPLEIHLGCTIGQILACPGLVLEGGLLSLVILPKKSRALDIYLAQYARDSAGMKTLNPAGKVVSSNSP